MRLFIVVVLILMATSSASLGDDVEDALVVFAEAGDLDKVRYLVMSKGAKANSRDSFGRVALIEAAGGGHLSVVRFLIERGADVNIRGSMGYTPLMKAIDAGHVEVVEFLGTKGADLGLRDSFGNLPLDLAEKGPSRAVYNHLRPIYARVVLTNELMQSAGKGHLGDVKQIIAAGISVNTQDGDGFTALMAASGYGKIQVVSWLIDHDADPNIVANNGVTALYVAVKHKYPKLVKYLLEHGARIQSVDSSVASVTAAARACGNAEIYKIIATRAEGDDLQKKYSDDYSRAIDTRQKYRSISSDSFTQADRSRVIAATDSLVHTKTKWIKELGEEKMDPILLRIMLSEFSTPKGRWDSDDKFRTNAAPVTPIMEAASYSKKEELGDLLKADVNVNERNGIGETALSILAFRFIPDLPDERVNSRLACAEMLINKGAEVNSTDMAGWTPLMWAAFNGDKPLVKLLIDKGADPKIASSSGATALSIAEFFGYENTAAIVKASHH